MRVICINDKCCNELIIMPKCGEEVTVSGRSPYYPDSYYIAEYPVDIYGNTQSIQDKHFIPLSTIDEMELVYNRQTELV